jgi:hypothetical protein
MGPGKFPDINGIKIWFKDPGRNRTPDAGHNKAVFQVYDLHVKSMELVKNNCLLVDPAFADENAFFLQEVNLGSTIEL